MIVRSGTQFFRRNCVSALRLPGLPGPDPGHCGGGSAPEPPDSMGPARPQTPGHFFHGEKVTKTPPGTPRTPLLSNWTPAREHCAATEFPFCLRLVVIGLGGYQLRLTALVLIGLSCRAERIDSSVPLKGRQAKLDKQPATDQKPGGFRNSVAEHYQSLMETD